MRRWCFVVIAALAGVACGGNAGSSRVDAGSFDAGVSGGEHPRMDGGTPRGDGAAGDDGSVSGGTKLFSPAPGTSWQWQLTGKIDRSLDVTMYDVDLFTTSQATIDALHAEGRVVICYFSAGSREDYRDDAGEFATRDYRNELEGWPGETWLDIRSANVRRIMKDRLDVARKKECDGVEPDNVDGYANDTGFALSAEDQLDYNRFLAREAHSRNLSVGLKNTLELVKELEPEFEWALDEECMAYDECELLKPFLSAGKAVFHVEYVDDIGEAAKKRDAICGEPSIGGFSTLVKGWDLGPEYYACK